ncbi:MAG: TonB family protein [Bacteroidetes bacterium]|nr:MAG: TonB family protein [Bacteroidota bacterium]TAG93855.1 MAG: TonB family protein [Bacteroidota bacterium]
MNRILLFTFVFVFFNAFTAFSQKIVYYNKEQKVVKKKKKSYTYGVVTEKKDTLNNQLLYVENQYFSKNDQIIQILHYKDKKRKIKHGLFTSFYEKDKIKTTGFYENNKKNGQWKDYYAGQRISALIDYNNDEKISESNVDENEVFTPNEVDKPADFVGGTKLFFKFLGNNTIYPKKARREGAGGTAYVEFIVDIDGSLIEVKIKKSSGNQSLDEEAIRVYKLSPKWQPAKQRSKPVKQTMISPIKFNLG